MVFKNIRFLLCTILITFVLSITSYAQSAISINGKVAVELEENYLRPVEGALIEVHRLDRKGYWSAKTDKSGLYFLLIPSQGTYLILLSGPGIDPLWANSTTLKEPTTIDFTSMSGEGKRLTRKEAEAMIAQGKSRPFEVFLDQTKRLQVKLAYSKGEKDEKFKEIEDFDTQVKKARLLQSRFDRAREHYNRGVESMGIKHFASAISEFEKVLAFDTSQHAVFVELSYKATANMAEAYHQMGFDLLLIKQPYNARQYFEKAINSAMQAISLAASSDTSEAKKELFNYYRQLAKSSRRCFENYGPLARIAESITVLDKLDADDPARQMIKAALYRYSGQPEKAVEIYAKATLVAPENLDAMYGVGMTLIELKDASKRREAENYLTNFLKKTDPSDDRITEVKETLASLKNSGQ
jgi:tetratricopeptide (TPR) repeat protein